MNLSLIDENIVVVVIIVAIDIWLGLWVYFSNRKLRVNQQFALITFLLLLWAVLCYTKSVLPQRDIALVLVRIAYGVVSILFGLFYFFLGSFPERKKRSPVLDKIVIGYSLFLFLVSFSESMVKSVSLIDGKNVPILGEGRFVYLILISILILFITVDFIVRYFSFTREEKLKAQYFLIGFFVFVLVNFIFNIVFPIFRGNARYACIGNHSVIFLLGFTAYAIVKRRLFGIKVVLTDLSVGITAVILLVLPFMVKTSPLVRALMLSVFIFFCFIGYFLIRYTHREIHQKEILEKAVKERTKELQRSYEDIEKRKADLEKFYKLTVGRELKMIELKKRIRELEGKEMEKKEHKI